MVKTSANRFTRLEYNLRRWTLFMGVTLSKWPGRIGLGKVAPSGLLPCTDCKSLLVFILLYGCKAWALLIWRGEYKHSRPSAWWGCSLSCIGNAKPVTIQRMFTTLIAHQKLPSSNLWSDTCLSGLAIWSGTTLLFFRGALEGVSAKVEEESINWQIWRTGPVNQINSKQVYRLSVSMVSIMVNIQLYWWPYYQTVHQLVRIKEYIG